MINNIWGVSSMSPTMEAQYKEQLQVGGVIQRSLVEFCKLIGEKK